jgi:hypothetical protein
LDFSPILRRTRRVIPGDAVGPEGRRAQAAAGDYAGDGMPGRGGVQDGAGYLLVVLDLGLGGVELLSHHLL